MIEIMPGLDSSLKVPLYVQLYEYIKKEIRKGSLKQGVKLPPKRILAQNLGVSQNTVHTAYEQLTAEGYVESKLRVGLFVKELEERPLPAQQFHDESNVFKKTREEYRYKIDFCPRDVDRDGFPYSTWKKLTVQCLTLDQSELLFTGEPQGEVCLREEIAKYLYQSRGVRCTSDQIVIGAGTQYLLILLSMIMGKEYPFAIEDPGYNRTRKVLEDLSRDIYPIPIDEEGVRVDALRETPSRVIYVTPSHQYPIGIIMSISRRLELLRWSEEKDGYIIEDDYDTEFRYKGQPVPSLQSMDSVGRVIYMGTFSKSLIPSIRISYLVLPPILVEKYLNHFILYKQTVSRIHQEVLTLFMRDGAWTRHINKMRTLYRRKHALLLNAIDRHLGKSVEIIGEKSGLHVLLRVMNDMSEECLIQTARDNGIKVYPTSIYCSTNKRIGVSPLIMIGFGGLTEFQIEEGVQVLKRAWDL